jgi:hypothetical protein
MMPTGERWTAILSDRPGLVLPPIYIAYITERETD